MESLARNRTGKPRQGKDKKPCSKTVMPPLHPLAPPPSALRLDQSYALIPLNLINSSSFHFAWTFNLSGTTSFLSPTFLNSYPMDTSFIGSTPNSFSVFNSTRLYSEVFGRENTNGEFKETGGLVMIRGVRRLLCDALCNINGWSRITC